MKILTPWSNHAHLPHFALLKETHFQNKQGEFMNEVVMSKFRSPSKALNIKSSVKPCPRTPFSLLKEPHFQNKQDEFMKEAVLANLVLLLRL